MAVQPYMMACRITGTTQGYAQMSPLFGSIWISLHARACAAPLVLAALAACAPAIVPTTAGTRFADLFVVQQQASRCAQTQGSWYAGLMACACPAETLFHPIDGCRVSPAWLRDPPQGMPHQTMLHLDTLAVCVDTPPADASKMSRLEHRGEPLDPTTFVLDRLTLPAQNTSHILTNALAEDIDAAYAVWVMGEFSSIGPHRSPWHPIPTRLPTIKKACAAALKRRGLHHAAALCDTAAVMQRELRKRAAPSAKRPSPWESIVWETMRETQLAQVRAQWKSPVAEAHYVIHLQDDGALQRHIRIEAHNERLVLFVDATGSVTAGAISDAQQTPERPWYFDAHWHQVVPK